MSFIAGLVHFGNDDVKSLTIAFENSLNHISANTNLPLEKIETDKYFFVKTGFPQMWQGPKILHEATYDAIASGIQSKEITSSNSALEYLSKSFLNNIPSISNYFDYFSLGIIDKQNERCILATDPLGIGQIAYCVVDATLLFI